jgi:hypothetical protein
MAAGLSPSDFHLKKRAVAGWKGFCPVLLLLLRGIL